MAQKSNGFGGFKKGFLFAEKSSQPSNKEIVEADKTAFTQEVSFSYKTIYYFYCVCI